MSEQEDYQLEVTDTNITVVSTGPRGAMYALTTLRQLLVRPANGTCFLHPSTVEDYPRFEYRGFLLDTSRNFFPKEDLYRLLDGMAYTKLNIFHWYITTAVVSLL